MKVRYKDEIIFYKLTTRFKSAVKKLFAKAFGLKRNIATIADIKRKFPKADLRKAIHWFMLVDYCDMELRKNAIPTSRELYDELLIAMGKFPVSICGNIDYLSGVSARIWFNNQTVIGRIGYSLIRKSWFYMIGKQGAFMLVNSASEAIEKLITHYGYKSA